MRVLEHILTRWKYCKYYPLAPYIFLAILSGIKGTEFGVLFSFFAFGVLLYIISKEGRLVIKNLSLLEIILLSSFTIFIFLSFFISDEMLKIIFCVWALGFTALALFSKRRKGENNRLKKYKEFQ